MVIALRSMLLTLFFICMILPSAKAVYDEDLSKTLLHLSAAAYGTADNRDQCVENILPTNEEWKIVANMDVEADSLNNICSGFIVASFKRKIAIVVFRGTKTPEQLVLEALKSFRMGKDFHGMGRVHSYFRKAIEKMWQPIYLFFQRHEDLPEEGVTIERPEKLKGYSVIFTGHSLGGALASLGAARIIKENLRAPSEVKLYTFGQPRTGSLLFSRNMDSYVDLGLESYRVVYRNDSVPHFPPCQENRRSPPNQYGVKPCYYSRNKNDEAEFYHHGTEIWYPNSMSQGSNFIICNGDPKNEDENCSNKFRYALLDEEIEQKAWDHRHYFDVSLVNFGKSGCTNRTNKPEPKKRKSRWGLDCFAGFFSLFKCKSKQVMMMFE